MCFDLLVSLRWQSLALKLILLPANESHKETHKPVPTVAQGWGNVIKKKISRPQFQKICKSFYSEKQWAVTHLQRTRKKKQIDGVQLGKREKYNCERTRNLYFTRELPFWTIAIEETSEMSTLDYSKYSRSTNGTLGRWGNGFKISLQRGKPSDNSQTLIRAPSLFFFCFWSVWLMCWSPVEQPPALSCVWADRRHRRTSLRCGAETSSCCLCNTAERCPSPPSWSSKLPTGQDKTIKTEKQQNKL